MAQQDFVQRLRRDHDELRRLIDRLEESKTMKARTARTAALVARLFNHSRLERTYLYPACADASLLLSDRILCREAEALNRLMEDAARSLLSTGATTEGSFAETNVLKLLLGQHWHGPTSHVFDRARSLLGRPALLALEERALAENRPVPAPETPARRRRDEAAQREAKAEPLPAEAAVVRSSRKPSAPGIVPSP